MKRLAGSLLLMLFAVGGILLAQDPPADEFVRDIRMTAKKYEFNPSVIRVRQGERVRLLITTLDRKHGIQIKEFGVKVVLPKKEETVVEFVADKAGEFKFKCSVRCGWHHGRMKGKLIVEPAS